MPGTNSINACPAIPLRKKTPWRTVGWRGGLAQVTSHQQQFNRIGRALADASRMEILERIVGI